MKTVTAKEFQLNQSKVMNEVSKGTVYQVTYHGKPWVELHPGSTQSGPSIGSMAAFQESLRTELSTVHLSPEPDYKALRRQHISKKYQAEHR